ncbi:ATP-binding protein, partial [Paenibacillus sp. 28ISP30-2]|nr:ATP-binding protein [Paenibacillus sp. 28ISP30-2]
KWRLRYKIAHTRMRLVTYVFFYFPAENGIRSSGKGLGFRGVLFRSRIGVWDRGKGIQEPEQDKVFERMYTLEDSRNKAIQGSGLGLTIAKRLVETMNGEIHLSSIPYERTVFSFTLKKINY